MSQRTTKLTDAGGQWRPNCQPPSAARVRCSARVRRPVNHHQKSFAVATLCLPPRRGRKIIAQGKGAWRLPPWVGVSPPPFHLFSWSGAPAGRARQTMKRGDNSFCDRLPRAALRLPWAILISSLTGLRFGSLCSQVAARKSPNDPGERQPLAAHSRLQPQRSATHHRRNRNA